jgi:opacity protein-like surface antigen
MAMSKCSQVATTIQIVGVFLALIACATVANAQDREGRWEFTLGTMYQNSAKLAFEGGSKVNTDSDFGFQMTMGYHMTDALVASFGLDWQGVGYDALVKRDNGSISSISGSYDAWATSVNFLYHLTEGPVVPYIGAGVGWTRIDSNVPSGLPSTGCWWDPWYGYVCYTSYPTHSTDAFSYQALAGIRYEYNPRSFVRLGYTSQWLDLHKATSTPRFDVFSLEFGWIF